MHGVQGVASSNPAAPTSNTKGFRLIAGNPFSFQLALCEKVPNKVPNRSQVWAGCASCPRTARHAACLNPCKRPAGLPRRGLDRRRRADEAPRHGSVPPANAVPSAPPPLRHCAGKQTTARRLAACMRLPCRVPHRAVTLRATASVATPGKRPARFAALNCTPQGRGKSQAIEHNSALPKATAPPAEKLLSAWAAARPAGSGNGLLCLAPQPGQLRYSALRVCLFRAAHQWLTLNRWAALSRLTARSLAGCAGQSVGGCRPTSTDFWHYRSSGWHWLY